ncbi:hypothetical protein E2562_036769, partial [Oryza meyeriana var. granulata]
MDGDAGGDPATGAGDVPFAGRYLPSRRRPGRRGAQFLPREESVDERLGRRHPELFDQLDLIRPGDVEVQQLEPELSFGKVFFIQTAPSDPEADEDKAEKDASEVSSSELGATTTDMPKFKTLSLNDSPSAPDSTDRVKEHADDVGSSKLGSTNKDLSKIEALSLDDSPHASGSTDG